MSYLIVRSKFPRGYDHTLSADLPAQPVLPSFTGESLQQQAEFVQVLKDEEGEKKILALGVLQGDRCFKFNTFQLPSHMSRSLSSRDDSKLFLLASDLAPLLNYRDAHHLFKKNKELHKILTDSSDNDYLLREHLISPKVVGKRLSAVTARSVFLVFGARIVINGVRIKDDYWETEFKAQGFTEESAVETRMSEEEVAAAQRTPIVHAKAAAAVTQSNPAPSATHSNNQSFQLKDGELSLAQLFPLAENPKFVNLQPDERVQYLENSQHPLVYPGQGFINSFEVNLLLKVPSYSGDAGLKDRKTAVPPVTSVFLAVSSEFIKIPVSNQALPGHSDHPVYAVNGLTYFQPAIQSYVRSIPEEKLAVLELQHSALHLNKLMQFNRNLRNQTWRKYYRQKAGTGEVRHDETLETRYEGETSVEVVRTQKRMNANALGNSNIKRVRPIYEPEPPREQTVPAEQNGYPLVYPPAPEYPSKSQSYRPQQHHQQLQQQQLQHQQLQQQQLQQQQLQQQQLQQQQLRQQHQSYQKRVYR